jgi:hypothetical protein
MKTAISLPDAVFEAADTLANRMHVSRSQLYVMALEKFIRENQEPITTKNIDSFIDNFGQPFHELKSKSSHADLLKVEW